MNDAFIDLCCLFWYARRLDGDNRSNAISEVGILAKAAGYTINDLAKVVTYAD